MDRGMNKVCAHVHRRTEQGLHNGTAMEISDQPMAREPLGGSVSWLPLGLRRTIRRLLPVGLKGELKKQGELAGPVFLSQIMVIMLNVISSVFCGHLGKIELDSVILAIAVINVTGISIGSGLASACDTLISQTYGSKNLKRVGTILQRGILILLLFCFPCWAIFVNTEPILLLFRQNPDVARLTQLYVMIFIPALPAVFLYQLQTRYLLNQGIIWPQVFTGIIVNIINASVNAILLHVLKLGVVGSAAANAVSQIAMSALLFAYIVMKKLYVETWGGWSKDCLQEWGSFIHLAVPSMLMMCIEWWSFELGGFLAGLISVVELGAQAIMLEVATVAYMIPVGFSAAASVRVGNALGAGNVEQAKLSAKVSLMCAVFFALICGALVAGLKDYVAYIFTSDREIVVLVSRLMLIFAPFHTLDAIACTCGGVLRGTGRQKIGAIMNAVGYYLVGLPIGISLMFAAKLGVVGLWSGMITCVFLQASFYFAYVLRLNWNKAVEEAQVRAGVKKEKPDSVPTTLQNETNSSTMIENGDAPSSSPNYANESEDSIGYIILPDMDFSDKHTDQLVQSDDSTIETTNVVGEVLSKKQLILWRGLAVVFAVVSLIIGVMIKCLIGNG